MNRIKKIIKKISKKNYKIPLLYFLIFIIVLHIGSIMYFQREIFTDKYDVEYWKERFEHSQWQVPLSTRPISDDALFSFIGYKLVNGMDPTSVNVETPPLGKYLIGLSIEIFKISTVYSLITFIAVTILLFVFFNVYIRDKIGALLVTSLVILDPLIFLQSWYTLLDLLQLSFLLINLIAVSILVYKKNIFIALIAGIGLGFFFGTKLPILSPLLFLFETILLLAKLRNIKFYLAYLLGIIISILIPYLNFFLAGNTIIDFIKIQKFIINFYAISKLDIQYGAVWNAILTGKIPDLVSKYYIDINEWSIFWPFISIFSLFYGFIIIKQRKDKFKIGLVIFIFLSFIIYSFIPFYTRYLVVLLPFLYLFAYLFLRTKLNNLFIFLIIIIFSLFNARLYLEPVPLDVINNFNFNLSNQNFNDIYKEQLISKKPYNSASNFHEKSKHFVQDAKIDYILPELVNLHKISDNQILATFEIEYFTKYLGSFSETKKIHLYKERSKWKINWDWDIILNGLKPEYTIKSNRILGTRGTIYDDKGNVLVRDEIGYLFSVNPKLYNPEREQELLNLLSKLIFLEPVNIQNGYLNDNTLGYIEIGTNFKKLTDQEINKLSSYKGVKIEEYPARIYYNLTPESLNNISYQRCCTRIYNAYFFRGIFGTEKEFDNILWGYDGGNIIIEDNKGELVREVISKDKKDGQDVTISDIKTK